MANGKTAKLTRFRSRKLTGYLKLTYLIVECEGRVRERDFSPSPWDRLTDLPQQRGAAALPLDLNARPPIQNWVRSGKIRPRYSSRSLRSSPTPGRLLRASRSSRSDAT